MTNHPLQWWEDGAGHTLGYCCLDTTTRNFARLGLLFLRDGEWDSEQVVSGEWVSQVRNEAASGYAAYTYQWWLPGQDQGSSLPVDVLSAPGTFFIGCSLPGGRQPGRGPEQHRRGAGPGRGPALRPFDLSQDLPLV